jgi:quinol monooxygenase YgiN
MYGTIMRARVKDGRKAEYERLLREVVPSSEDYGRGLHSVEMAWQDDDPQRLVMIVHFRDKESYIANANRPETDSDYQRQLELLEGPPEWIDVNYTDYVGQALKESAAPATA